MEQKLKANSVLQENGDGIECTACKISLNKKTSGIDRHL
jgi:hypothetical protein